MMCLADCVRDIMHKVGKCGKIVGYVSSTFCVVAFRWWMANLPTWLKTEELKFEGKQYFLLYKYWQSNHTKPQFSSVQSLDRLGRQEDMRDDLAEILFQSFLQEASVSSSGIGRDVHSLMLSIQHFLCRPRRRPPSKVPRRMVLERLSLRMTCPNHGNFPPLKVAWRGSCGPTRKLILLRTHSLDLCSV